MIYPICFALILIGIYGVLVRRNIVKIIISLLVIEYGIHLFLVLLCYRPDGLPPIVERGMESETWMTRAVDPLPQALVLTSIVIGLGILALMVALALRLHQRYGTYDISNIKRLKG